MNEVNFYEATFLGSEKGEKNIYQEIVGKYSSNLLGKIFYPAKIFAKNPRSKKQIIAIFDDKIGDTKSELEKGLKCVLKEVKYKGK